MPNSYFDLNGGPAKPSRSLAEKITSTLIVIAGFKEDILRKYCPAFEVGGAIAIGCVAVAAAVLNAGIFSVAGSTLFGSGHFSFGATLGGIMLALTIAAVESYGGRTLHIGDMKGLQRGGFVFPQPERYAASTTGFGVYRAGIAVLTALVATTGLSLVLYRDDIAAKVHLDDLDRNRTIYQQAGQSYDLDARRLNDAIANQSAVVARDEREVSALSQDAVRKTVGATRRNSAVGIARDNAQLERFEKTLADEKAKLARLREDSVKQTEVRNAKVTQLIDTNPEKVQRQDGLIGRIAALHSLIAENPSVLAIFIAIDLLLAALDCSGFIVRLFAPTSIYSAFVAKTLILESVAQAKDCADKLAVYQTEADGSEKIGETDAQVVGTANLSNGSATDQPAAANDDAPNHAKVNGATPPRKGAGRPKGSRNKRGNGLDRIAGEPGHE